VNAAGGVKTEVEGVWDVVPSPAVISNDVGGVGSWPDGWSATGLGAGACLWKSLTLPLTKYTLALLE